MTRNVAGCLPNQVCSSPCRASTLVTNRTPFDELQQQTPSIVQAICRTPLEPSHPSHPVETHKARSSGEGLVFTNGEGKPLTPGKVRRDIWIPLKARAGVRDLDLRSLRHTFASLGRTAGESAFNVARMMGHSRSTLVDQVRSLDAERHSSRCRERDRSSARHEA